MARESLADFKKRVCGEAYGRQPDGKTCVSCNKVPMQNVNMQTEAGWQEFRISGLCESCFDACMADDEDDAG